MKKIYKILIPSAVALGVIGTFAENDTPNTNLMDSNNSSYIEKEVQKDVDDLENQIVEDSKKEEANDKTNDKTPDKATDKASDKVVDKATDNTTDKATDKVADKTSTNTTNNDSKDKTTNSKDTNKENQNLPLKAICNDGTISYQDDSSKDNYRGMCSGHDGIKEKLGRVK